MTRASLKTVGGDASDRPSRVAWIAPWILMLAALFVYANSFSGVFLLDDESSILNAPALRSTQPWRDVLESSARPLTDLTFLVNYQLGGHQLWGYHLGNLVIHIAASLSLWGLLRQALCHSPKGVFAAKAGPARSELEFLSFAGALLWTVHPLQTMALTYICQRYESLSGCCSLAALWWLLAARRARRPWIWQFLSVAGACGAVFAKPSGFAVLPLLGLFDWAFTTESLKTRLRLRGWMLMLLLPVAVWALAPASSGLITVPDSHSDTAAIGATLDIPDELGPNAGFGYQAVSSWEYLRSQSGVLLHYGWLVIFPHKLCFDYGWPVAERWQSWVPQGIAILGLLASSGWICWKWRGIYAFPLAAFLALAPTSSILPIRDLANEYRMYLPSAFLIPFVVLVMYCGLCRALSPEPPRSGWVDVTAWSCVLLAAVALGTRTIVRNADYADRVRLWSSSVAIRPESVRGLHNLGDALLRAGRPQDALVILQRAAALSLQEPHRRFTNRDEQSLIHNRVGTAYHEMGDFHRALREFEAAIEMNPSSPLAWSNLANGLSILGQFERASAAYVRALELAPQDPKVRFDQANLFAVQGDLESAIAGYDDVLKLQPEHPDAGWNRAQALLDAGRVAEAIEAIQELVKLGPPNSPRVLGAQRELARLFDEHPQGGP